MLTLLFGFLLAFAVDVDNASVRVLDVVDQPHQPTPQHRHEVNRVMIYLTEGDQTIRHADGRVEKLHWNAGQAAWSPAGGLHISENIGATPLRIIEIELKKPAPEKAVVRKRQLDPVAIDPAHNTLLFENAQVRVFRSIREAGGTEMMHEHAGTGRVGVFLTPLTGTVKLPDGSSSAIHVSAGDVSWSPPVTHATTNLGPNKLEMIVVEVN